MDQLLSIHRLSLEKNLEPTAAEQKALADAEQLFSRQSEAISDAEHGTLHVSRTTEHAWQPRRRSLSSQAGIGSCTIRKSERLWRRAASSVFWRPRKLEFYSVSVIAGWLLSVAVSMLRWFTPWASH